ncbi:hypothetical protein [Neosynechococcus sphagnicola]|uniref:DUF7925 domain-containing protein n=1 Tax=Neosynechococcus sphagnicola TaxID=1501145 RepID=UPI0019554314|nr:hypothetical protein [Neosynechococcus sphagnicola]
MGNTGANDNSAGTQNQDSATDGANADEVRTVDNSGTTNGDTAGAPVNNEREASAFQQTTVASAITTRALATVLKTQSLYTNLGTPATFSDDLITYRLDLRVQQTSPNSSFLPGTLEGTAITNAITGAGGVAAGTPVILVSDAIPANTTLDTSFNPALPAGWIRIYTTTATTTSAINAQWSTTVPGGTITRVGFFFTGTMAPGDTTVTNANGFQFRVTTSGVTAGGGQIANIAQAVGETQGDTSNVVNYDESGDQQPNNFNADGTTTDPTGAGGTPTTGVANPTADGVDNNNNNTGTGPNGEDNVFTLTPAGNILNGPGGQPAATGPDNTNQTDFVNKSSTDMPANSQATFDPAAVTFNNTVRNPGSSTLDNVVIRPITPSLADAAADGTGANQTDPNTAFGTNAGLPNGTTVTITLGAQSATYTWDATGSSWDTVSPPASPVRFSGFVGPTSIDYTVTVNLPAGTSQTTPFPIPIAAFVDSDTDNIFDGATAEPIFNIKIDRLYTGYVTLLKESRILQGSGPSVTGGQGTV